MTEWSEVLLGDVLTLKRGYDLPKRSRREGPVPIVSSSGPTGFHDEAKSDPPGVVTGRYGTLGKVYYNQKTPGPPADDSVFSAYLRAKAKADAYLMDSSLDWTVVRPGRLTNDPPTGRVRIDRYVPRGEITRADVAAVLLECLGNDGTIGMVFEVVGGDTPIHDAVAAAVR